MEKKVAIILVNYNAQQYMDEFLGSVYLQDYSNIEIVLVDNMSTDSSIAWLKDNASSVRVIELQENVGFGEGCNIGMRYAIEELGAEYVLLLNIDTVLQPNLISELQRYADENTVVTSRIYCGDKKGALEPWYAGGEIDRSTAQINQLLYPVPESEVYEVGFISGCCMMLHKKVIDKIGYFDRQFFLYYEDTDYCVRLQNAGIAMKYITTTSLWHKVGGSSLGGSEASCSTQYYVTRNRLLFAEKYSWLFLEGNLSILRKILEERAFFDGMDNAKHRFYVQTAIADHLKGHYGKGYYGRALLEKGYYMANGFYEKEDGGEQYWYWASERCATVYLANPRRQSGVYKVSFELSPAIEGNKQMLEVAINGKDRAEYSMPGHVEFAVPISGEGVVRLDLTFWGTEKTDIVDGNKRTLYYQLLNLIVMDSSMDYCVLGETYPQEQDENDFWQWSASKVCKIYVVNRTLQSKAYVFKSAIENVDGNKYGLQIYNQGKLLTSIKTMAECCVPIELSPNGIYELELRCEAPVVFDYGRRVCFKLKNIVFKEAEEELYWGECFLPEEHGEGNSWRWATERQGIIRAVNAGESFVWKYLNFKVLPFKQELQGEIHIYQNGVDVTEHCERDGNVRMLIGLPPMKLLELGITAEWPVVKDGERDICFCVSDMVLENFDKDIFYGSTFGALESDGISTWSWNRGQSGNLIVPNRQDTPMRCVLELEVLPYNEADELDRGTVEIGEVSKKIEFGKRKKFLLEIAPHECISLKLNTALPIYEVLGQEYCFQVRNVSLEILQSGLYFDEGFYSKESDGKSYWCWCSENRGKIQIANMEDTPKWKYIGFKVSPFTQGMTGGIHVYQKGRDMTKHCVWDGDVKLLAEISPMELVELDVTAEWPVVRDGERNICFCISDIVLEDYERDIFYGSTFGIPESDGINSWSWNRSQSGNIAVLNRKDVPSQCILELEMLSYSEEDAPKEGIIEIGGVSKKIELGKRKSFYMGLPPHECVTVTFNAALPIYEECGQNYCFQLRNVKLEALPSGLYFDDEFYVEESDGKNSWRWCAESHGKLYIVNAKSTDTLKEMSFTLMVPDGQNAEFEVWHEQKQLLQGICGREYCVQITGKPHNMEEVEIICHVDKKCISGRALGFGIYNVVVSDENKEFQ